MNSPIHERGVGLIIVIIVTAFLLVVGLMLAMITGVGTSVASNIRLQEQAFNAAEAGFNAAWIQVEENLMAAGWTDFDGHCLDTPSNIANPGEPEYFRKQTDEELLNALTAATNGVIFYKQTYVPAQGGGFDQRYSYTVFLVEDDGGGMNPDPSDALLICIGTVQAGNRITTARLEVDLAMQNAGTNP
jgi:Tfp pilus assembly protein PilX